MVLFDFDLFILPKKRKHALFQCKMPVKIQAFHYPTNNCFVKLNDYFVAFVALSVDAVVSSALTSACGAVSAV